MTQQGDGTRLFLYGSLRRGGSHQHLVARGRHEGSGRLEAYEMIVYEEGFPAIVAVPGGRCSIVGDVALVSPELLAELDRFEDCPKLYQRRVVTLQDGRAAQAYVVDRARSAGWPRVSSGDWLAWLRASR